MNIASISKKLDEISAQLMSLIKRSDADLRAPSFPSAGPDVDGPVPPESFRLDGRLYGPFTRLEWRLLACLWDNSALEVGDVLDALYGHDHEQDQDALRSVVKRLNPKLRKQSFPGTIVVRKGYASVERLGRRQERPHAHVPYRKVGNGS